VSDNFVAKDASGANFTIRSTDLGSSVHAVHHRITDGSGNLMPTGDTAARRLYVQVSDGTNSMPSGDAAARRVYVQHTDGTNSTPSMDTAARAGFVKVTDGTNTQPTMDAAARAGYVYVTNGTQTMPTGDAVARRIYVQHTDGTNSTPSMDSAARPGFVTQVAGTTGGTTPYQLVSAASTNSTNVKGSAGKVYGIQVNNANAAVRYLKLYDKATAPTIGSDTPVKTIMIPAGGTVVIQSAQGIAFASGIGFGLTTEATVAGTTAVSANEHVVNLEYA